MLRLVRGLEGGGGLGVNLECVKGGGWFREIGVGRTLGPLVSAKDLAVAEDEVELLVEKGAVGRERARVGVRGGDGGCGCAHLVGED